MHPAEAHVCVRACVSLLLLLLLCWMKGAVQWPGRHQHCSLCTGRAGVEAVTGAHAHAPWASGCINRARPGHHHTQHAHPDHNAKGISAALLHPLGEACTGLPYRYGYFLLSL